MGFFAWVESKVKKLHWYDISLIKTSTLAFTLMLAKLWPPLLSLDWKIYLAIAIIAALPVMRIYLK